MSEDPCNKIIAWLANVRVFESGYCNLSLICIFAGFRYHFPLIIRQKLYNCQTEYEVI